MSYSLCNMNMICSDCSFIVILSQVGELKLADSMQDIVEIFVHYRRNDEKIIYTLVFSGYFFLSLSNAESSE